MIKARMQEHRRYKSSILAIQLHVLIVESTGSGVIVHTDTHDASYDICHYQCNRNYRDRPLYLWLRGSSTAHLLRSDHISCVLVNILLKSPIVIMFKAIAEIVFFHIILS